MDPKPLLLEPGCTLSLEIYRCPNCSVGFGQERTVAGPKFCPACGLLFGVVQHIRVQDLLTLIDASVPGWKTDLTKDSSAFGVADSLAMDTGHGPDKPKGGA